MERIIIVAVSLDFPQELLRELWRVLLADQLPRGLELWSLELAHSPGSLHPLAAWGQVSLEVRSRALLNQLAQAW